MGDQEELDRIKQGLIDAELEYEKLQPQLVVSKRNDIKFDMDPMFKSTRSGEALENSAMRSQYNRFDSCNDIDRLGSENVPTFNNTGDLPKFNASQSNNYSSEIAIEIAES